MLADLIFKLAVQLQQEPQDYRPRPSGWNNCIRASTYHGLGYPPKSWSGRFVVLLEESTFGEELTADWIRKSAFKLHSQQLQVVIGSTRGGQEIHGSIDGLLEDLLGNEMLWENKRLNMYTFERMEGALGDGIWDETIIKYVHQAVAYLVGLGRLSSINKVLLLIQNRNTLAFLEVLGTYDSKTDTFTIDHALSTRISEKSEGGIAGQIDSAKGMILSGVFASFLSYFNKVEEYILAKTLPTRPYELGSWQCNYCRWNEECFKGFDKEIAAMAEGVEFPEDLRETLLSFIQWRDAEKEAEGKKDEARSIIANELQAQGIRKAKTKDGISVSLSVVEKTGIDKELIPPAILKAAEKKTSYLKVDVRKPRTAKEKT